MMSKFLFGFPLKAEGFGMSEPVCDGGYVMNLPNFYEVQRIYMPMMLIETIMIMLNIRTVFLPRADTM